MGSELSSRDTIALIHLLLQEVPKHEIIEDVMAGQKRPRIISWGMRHKPVPYKSNIPALPLSRDATTAKPYCGYFPSRAGMCAREFLSATASIYNGSIPTELGDLA
jgi:hypothetical protein